MFFNRVPLSSAVAPVADQAAVPHEFPDVPDEAMDIQEEDEQAEAPDDDGDGVGPVMNADVPAQGHVVVNGIELHLGCALTTLRTACEVLASGNQEAKPRCCNASSSISEPKSCCSSMSSRPMESSCHLSKSLWKNPRPSSADATSLVMCLICRLVRALHDERLSAKPNNPRALSVQLRLCVHWAAK